MRRWRAHEKGCGGLALAAWAELARLSRPRPAPYGPHGRGRASARRRRAARETSPPAPRRRPCKMHLLLLFYVPVLQSIHAWSHARVQGRVARALAAGARVRPALLEQQPCHLPPLHACMRDAAGHATPLPRQGGRRRPTKDTDTGRMPVNFRRTVCVGPVSRTPCAHAACRGLSAALAALPLPLTAPPLPLPPTSCNSSCPPPSSVVTVVDDGGGGAPTSTSALSASSARTTSACPLRLALYRAVRPRASPTCR
jgi:hypothetical protein